MTLLYELSAARCEQTYTKRDIHTPRERVMEKLSMRRTNLEVLSSFDLIVTSIMQIDNESMSVCVNRNGQRRERAGEEPPRCA